MSGEEKDDIKNKVKALYYEQPFIGDKLKLKPISAMEEDEIVEVAKICGFEILNGEYKVHRLKKQFVVTEFGEDEFSRNSIKIWFLNALNEYYFDLLKIKNNLPYDISVKRAIKAYQYLQSQGYDFEQYLLGDKTLKEYDLATYE